MYSAEDIKYVNVRGGMVGSLIFIIYSLRGAECIAVRFSMALPLKRAHSRHVTYIAILECRTLII